MKRKNGFTLIELIVITGILGIVVAIALPYLGRHIENSREAVLNANCKSILSFIQATSLQFDKDHMFQNSRDSMNPDYESRIYLSQYIEEFFETAGYGKTNFNLLNLYSKKTGILNYSNYKLNSTYSQQAIVISNNSDLKYSSTVLTAANGKRYLMGSIIVYLVNGDSSIEVYYIDKDGKKSKNIYRISSLN